MKKRQSRPLRRLRPENTKCFFCEENKVPDYKEIEILDRYTTDRGKILARARTGTCRKHQRLVMRAIKRARHLALLPFVPGISA